jgi:hypothetical protein
VAGILGVGAPYGAGGGVLYWCEGGGAQYGCCCCGGGYCWCSGEGAP